VRDFKVQGTKVKFPLKFSLVTSNDVHDTILFKIFKIRGNIFTF
jgi:hypothetical protein